MPRLSLAVRDGAWREIGERIGDNDWPAVGAIQARSRRDNGTRRGIRQARPSMTHRERKRPERSNEQ